MTASGQLQMFESEGRALIPLVSHYLRTHDQQFKRGENLQLCGFTSASNELFREAIDAFHNAQICEMTFQLEQLAELV